LKIFCCTTLLLCLPLSGCGGSGTKETPREVREFSEAATELKLDMGSVGNSSKKDGAESDPPGTAASQEPDASGDRDAPKPAPDGDSPN
jgi:hypothetical protein